MTEPVVLQREVNAGNKELRAALEEAGYSRWVSDEKVNEAVTRILFAAAKARGEHK